MAKFGPVIDAAGQNIPVVLIWVYSHCFITAQQDFTRLGQANCHNRPFTAFALNGLRYCYSLRAERSWLTPGGALVQEPTTHGSRLD